MPSDKVSRKTWREVRRVLWNVQFIFALGQKLSQCAFYRGGIEWKHGNIVCLLSVVSLYACVYYACIYVCMSYSVFFHLCATLSFFECMSIHSSNPPFPFFFISPSIKKNQQNNKLTEIKSMFSILPLSVDFQQIL